MSNAPKSAYFYIGEIAIFLIGTIYQNSVCKGVNSSVKMITTIVVLLFLFNFRTWIGIIKHILTNKKT